MWVSSPCCLSQFKCLEPWVKLLRGSVETSYSPSIAPIRPEEVGGGRGGSMRQRAPCHHAEAWWGFLATNTKSIQSGRTPSNWPGVRQERSSWETPWEGRKRRRRKEEDRVKISNSSCILRSHNSFVTQEICSLHVCFQVFPVVGQNHSAFYESDCRERAERCLQAAYSLRIMKNNLLICTLCIKTQAPYDFRQWNTLYLIKQRQKVIAHVTHHDFTWFVLLLSFPEVVQHRPRASTEAAVCEKWKAPKWQR